MGGYARFFFRSLGVEENTRLLARLPEAVSLAWPDPTQKEGLVY